jgi:hypothetical protein
VLKELHLGILASVDHLQILCDEFHVSDRTRPRFHLTPFLPFLFQIGFDFRLHSAHILSNVSGRSGKQGLLRLFQELLADGESFRR